MRVKNLIDEDFQNYKKCSMFIGTAVCDWKCCNEAGAAICQNLPLAKAATLEVDDKVIVKRYASNPLTSAIVIGGLEPFDQWGELVALIKAFRAITEDTIVIYTGYREDELVPQIKQLKQFKNIIVKFGRYVPNQPSHYDEVLGIKLASPNQYAKIL